MEYYHELPDSRETINSPFWKECRAECTYDADSNGKMVYTVSNCPGIAPPPCRSAVPAMLARRDPPKTHTQPLPEVDWTGFNET
jgi:hypothetical protein